MGEPGNGLYTPPAVTEVVIIDPANTGSSLAAAVHALGYRVSSRARTSAGLESGASAVIVCPNDGSIPDLAPIRAAFGEAVGIVLYIPTHAPTPDLAEVVTLGADRILRAPVSGEQLRECLYEVAGPPGSMNRPTTSVADDLDLDAYGLDNVPDPPVRAGKRNRQQTRKQTRKQPRKQTRKQPIATVKAAPTRKPAAAPKHAYTSALQLLASLWTLVDRRATGTWTVQTDEAVAVIELGHGMVIEPLPNMYQQRNRLRVGRALDDLQAAERLAAGDLRSLVCNLAVGDLAHALTQPGSWHFTDGPRLRPPVASLPALMLTATSRALSPSTLLSQLGPGSRRPTCEVAKLPSLCRALAHSLELPDPQHLALLDGTRTLDVLRDVHGIDQLLPLCLVLEAGHRLTWQGGRQPSTTNRRGQQRRLDHALALARRGHYLELLGVAADDPPHVVRAAHRQRLADFSADTFSELLGDAGQQQRDNLKHLHQALDEACELLCDEPLRTLYLTHLPAPEQHDS